MVFQLSGHLSSATHNLSFRILLDFSFSFQGIIWTAGSSEYGSDCPGYSDSCASQISSYQLLASEAAAVEISAPNYKHC